jgi:hypothetical protein
LFAQYIAHIYPHTNLICEITAPIKKLTLFLQKLNKQILPELALFEIQRIGKEQAFFHSLLTHAASIEFGRVDWLD